MGRLFGLVLGVTLPANYSEKENENQFLHGWGSDDVSSGLATFLNTKRSSARVPVTPETRGSLGMRRNAERCYQRMSECG